MLRKFSTVIVAAAALGVTGCAEYGGYTPTVDTYNDPYAQNMTRDMQDCKALAKQASGGGVKESATGAVVGGLVGAAAGAAMGAAVGNPGGGAALGAAAGGVGGGAYKGMSSDEAYKSAYKSCMRKRGHNVIE